MDALRRFRIQALFLLWLCRACQVQSFVIPHHAAVSTRHAQLYDQQRSSSTLRRQDALYMYSNQGRRLGGNNYNDEDDQDPRGWYNNDEDTHEPMIDLSKQDWRSFRAKLV